MFFDKRYVAEVLYDTLLRNGGELFADLSMEPLEFQEETGLEIESYEDVETIQEALKLLAEHNLIESNSGDLTIQAILIENSPPADDIGISPLDKKTNLSAKLSPEVLRDLYAMNLELE